LSLLSSGWLMLSNSTRGKLMYRRRLCMTCRKADRFRSAFATRCAWPPEINAARTYAVTKRSSAILTAALRRQRSHVRIVSGAPLRYRTGHVKTCRLRQPWPLNCDLTKTTRTTQAAVCVQKADGSRSDAGSDRVYKGRPNSIADGSGLIEVSVARATSTKDLGLQFNRISGQLGIDSQAIQVSRQLHG
jgi:hypothetical protein